MVGHSAFWDQFGNYNWVAVALAVCVVHLVSKADRGKYIKQRPKQVCTCLFLFALTVLFEIYVFMQCPCSPAYQDGTNEAARMTVAFLDYLGKPYWAEAGTMLTILRDNDIMKWDADSDFGITQFESQTEVDHFMSQFDVFLDTVWNQPGGETRARNEALGRTYERARMVNRLSEDGDRTVYQVWIGPYHSDIWAYVPTSQFLKFQHLGLAGLDHTAFQLQDHDFGECDEGQFLKCVMNVDHTFKNDVSIRSFSDIFPLRRTLWKHFRHGGIEVYMPMNSKVLMEGMFGPDYMTPYYQRQECFTNIFDPQGLRAGALVYVPLLLLTVCYAGMMFILGKAIHPPRGYAKVRLGEDKP
jgi:hypothetical protein